jgi:hypothetical protein
MFIVFRDSSVQRTSKSAAHNSRMSVHDRDLWGSSPPEPVVITSFPPAAVPELVATSSKRERTITAASTNPAEKKKPRLYGSGIDAEWVGVNVDDVDDGDSNIWKAGYVLQLQHRPEISRLTYST